MPVDFNIINRFSKLKRVGENQYMALCPAHNDHNPSLSIRIERDKLLLHCHAGCRHKDILDAVGLTESDLFAKNEFQTRTVVEVIKYPYVDENGEVIYIKERYNYSDNTKSFAFNKPDGSNGVNGVRRVPFNLSGIMDASTIYFVEGEKCAQALIDAGLAATTLDSGSNSKWDTSFNQFFYGKNVIIIPDNDAPGKNYAIKILNNLQDAKVLLLHGLRDKEDIYDWLKKGHKVNELFGLPILNRETYINSINIGETDGEPKTQAEKLLRLIEQNNLELFYDEFRRGFAAFMVNGHRETHLVDSVLFELWLTKLFYEKYKQPINTYTLKKVKDCLTAEALFNGKRMNLYTRTAIYEGSIYYDLTNDNWQSVCISSSGWKICDIPPIIFERFEHQRPQVAPIHGDYDLFNFFSLINIKDEYKLLFLVWLVSSFWPNIPHPMAVFYGSAGAAKTTACKLIKKIIDPSTSGTLTVSRDDRSRTVTFLQNYYLPFDNLSRINDELSDIFCRVITGTSIEQRKLYKNLDMVAMNIQRIVSINGIVNVIEKPDLRDRSIFFEVERITDKNRREEQEIFVEFEKVLPRLLGEIFSVLSLAMKIYPNVKLQVMPRMADFTRVGYAIAEALGGMGEQFIKDYSKNRNTQDIEILNESPIATAIYLFLQEHKKWEGTASGFLKEVTAYSAKIGIDSSDPSFPRFPNVLIRRINEIKNILLNFGIEFKTIRKASGCIVMLRNLNQ